MVTQKKMTPEERTAKLLYRALQGLANFSDSKKVEVWRRVTQLLREDDWNSVADFVESLGK